MGAAPLQLELRGADEPRAAPPQHRPILSPGDVLVIRAPDVVWGVSPGSEHRLLARARRCTAGAAATARPPPEHAKTLPVAPPREDEEGAGAGASWQHVPALEREHVVNVYETIAGHWDQTRHTPWPRVVEFLRALPAHALVADVGCGNGKYLGVAAGHIAMLGSDRSVNLVEICRRQGHEVAVCDNMLLPYRDGAFDAVLSIAVLHHFSTHARRRRALEELARILLPGGRMLVQAWALEQVSALPRAQRT